MWHGFSHVFLTTVWSKMRPNLLKIPSIFCKLHGNSMTWTCPKIHIMFQHGKQNKTWINDMEFPWESMSYSLQGVYRNANIFVSGGIYVLPNEPKLIELKKESGLVSDGYSGNPSARWSNIPKWSIFFLKFQV